MTNNEKKRCRFFFQRYNHCRCQCNCKIASLLFFYICVSCLQSYAWVFEQQLSCEYLFSNLKNEHLVSIVIAIFPAINVSVQLMTEEGVRVCMNQQALTSSIIPPNFSVIQINFSLAVENWFCALPLSVSLYDQSCEHFSLSLYSYGSNEPSLELLQWYFLHKRCELARHCQMVFLTV